MEDIRRGTQIRMVERRVNVPSKGSMKSNMPLICQRPFGVGSFLVQSVSSLFFSVTISGDSAAYFFEIIMHISLKGTLTQTRT